MRTTTPNLKVLHTENGMPTRLYGRPVLSIGECPVCGRKFPRTSARPDKEHCSVRCGRLSWSKANEFRHRADGVWEILLNHGQTALIDDIDYERVRQHRWWAEWSRCGQVWRVSGWVDFKQVYLHQFIMGEGLFDHKNRQPLDNRRENLRPCTFQQNVWNSGRKNSTGFRGVRRSYKRYASRIMIDGELVTLGYFKTAEDAARAYDEAAFKLRGEFAVLNFGQPTGEPNAL